MWRRGREESLIEAIYADQVRQKDTYSRGIDSSPLSGRSLLNSANTQKKAGDN